MVATPSDSLPPDRAGSPSSLIVTFAGCYLRQIGGWIGVADLIRLLELVGVSEPAVRQSVLRLKSRGFFESGRRGGVAGYALTDVGRADLEPGDRRIFRYGRADHADGWVLAVFSVPESHRRDRHQLRSQLGWLGFGQVGSGVWAAPAGLADQARALLSGAGLDGYVTWFRASALDPVDVSTWWDLDSLRQQYQTFLNRWAPCIDPSTTGRADGVDGTVGTGWMDRTAGTAGTGRTDSTDDAADRIAFAQYVQLVDSWRLFPRIDPGLPADLLPPGWPGPAAWQTFSALRERWADAGLRYVAAVTAQRQSS